MMEVEVPETVYINTVISKKRNLSLGTLITCLGSYVQQLPRVGIIDERKPDGAGVEVVQLLGS